MSTEAFKSAASTVIPFGKYRGKTIDAIAKTDAGLLYLDWARGEWTQKYLVDAINEYLNDPVIARELSQAMQSRRSNSGADRAYGNYLAR